jgi:hypothetical protein
MSMTSRRNFVKITGAAGAAIIVAGWSSCARKGGEVKILNRIDGDMLTGNDGTVKDGALLTQLVVSAPRGLRIKINGIPAKYNGENFAAEILLKDHKNDITVFEKRSGSSQTITVYWLKNILGKYRFSLDDNILFLKDINANSSKYKSIFDNAYLGLLKQVHDTFGTKIHINIYYQTEGFNLSQMTAKYKSEWKENAGWLHLSFHALQNDPDRPYIASGYDEVKRDCEMVKEQIRRFAGEEVMSPETTLHWGAATVEGCRALRDCGYKALAGYFVVEKGEEPVSYYLDDEKKLNLSRRIAWKDNREDVIFSRINIVINNHKLEEIVPYLDNIKKDPFRSAFMEVMIHEQYFHPTYVDYQPDYREKVIKTIEWVTNNGYKPAFLSEVLFS